MSLSPRLVDHLRTAIVFAVVAQEDESCPICKQDLLVDRGNWEIREGVQPWRPGEQAVPWDVVTETWVRATGHHPECPVKHLADFVIAYDDLDIEPAPAAGRTRTHGEYAIHFLAWLEMHMTKWVTDETGTRFAPYELAKTYDRAMGDATAPAPLLEAFATGVDRNPLA